MPKPSTSELVAINVHRLRTRLGISQTELAELMDVAPARISELEHGRSGVSGTTLDKLADALQCQPQELLMQPNAGPDPVPPRPIRRGDGRRRNTVTA